MNWEQSFYRAIEALHLKQIEGGSWVSQIDPGEPGCGKPRISITNDEGEFLESMAAGCFVLEIGTGLGISTRYLARHAELVYTIDCDAWVQKHVFPTLDDLGNVCHSATIPDDLDGVDLGFIDGCHHPDEIQKDITRIRPYILAGGSLVFHDANVESIRELFRAAGVVRYIASEHGLGVVPL